MADVMHAIASIFSRPSASWGFDGIDKSGETSVKVEEDLKLNGDTLMTYDDSSDSDIEIVGVVKRHPQPQARPCLTLASSNPFTSDRTSKERTGRKREESFVDLARDESPKKKIKLDDEQEKNTTASLPNKDTVPSSSNSPTAHKKRPTMTSPELVKRLGNTIKAASHNSLNNHFRVTGSQQLSLKSSATPSSITPNTAPAMNRRRMPFEEDDDDDDVEDEQPLELRGSKSKPAAASSIFSRMWSEPNKPNGDLAASTPELAKKGHRQLATERPNNRNEIPDSTREDGKAPVVSDSITYQPFKPARASERPLTKAGGNLTKSENDRRSDASSPKSDSPSVRPTARLGGNLGTQRPVGNDFSSFLALSDSKPTIGHKENGHSANTHATTPRRNSRLKAVDIEEERHRMQRQEDARKRQEELTAKIKKAAVPERLIERNSINNPQPERTITASVPVEAHDNRPGSKALSEVLLSPEELRKKEEAANARKQADLRREREARQRAQEKSDAERRAWEEKHKALEARRAEERRKQTQAQKEANIMSERMNALSKLGQVKKPPKAVENATKTNHESKSSFGGLLEEVSARPRTMQSPSLFEIKDTTSEPSPATHQAGPGLHPTASTKSETTLPNRSASTEHTDATKACRIPQKEEQNEREGKAEKEREQRQTADATTPASQLRLTSLALPKGPVSLNGAIGQNLLAQAELPIPKSAVEPGRPLAGQYQVGKRSLGEILAQDIDLVKWRTTGITYKEIFKLFEKKYQQRRGEDAFRSRYKQVKQALDDNSIPSALREQGYDGCEEARQEINRILHGSWPLATAAGPSALPQTGGRRAPVKKGPPAKAFHSTSNDRGTVVSPASSFGSGTLEGSPAPEASQDRTDLSERPTTGGKVLNEKALFYYLEGVREAWEQDVAEEKAQREPSPFADDDYASFAYQVERRELCQEAIEEDENIDDMIWVRCDRPFDRLRDANKEAIKQIFRGPEGRSPAVDTRHGFEHKTEINNGMAFHELKGKHGGVRQVQVSRIVQTLQPGVFPQNKDGWAERTAFVVKQRTVVEPKDDMFEETRADEVRERISETDVESTLYTVLDLANTAAIKKFVEMTFTSNSVNLTQRQIEIQEAEQQLMKNLDEYDLFHESAGDDSGLKTVDVWVEEVELVGPRNLY